MVYVNAAGVRLFGARDVAEMLSTPPQPRGQRMLDIGVGNADRLMRLLNDVLDLERMRAGAPEAGSAAV